MKTLTHTALTALLLTSTLTLFACGTELSETLEAPRSETQQAMAQRVTAGLGRMDLTRVARIDERPAVQSPALKRVELTQIAKALDFPTVIVEAGAQQARTDSVLMDHRPHRGTLLAIHQPAQAMLGSLHQVRARDAEFMQRHHQLITELGVPAGERVDVDEPKLLMGRGYEQVDGELQPTGEPVVHGVSVISRRMVDGIPVQGSQAAVLFDPEGKVIALNVNWPAFELHPELAAAGVRSRDDLVYGIAARVLTSHPDAKAELKMGLVYRPVVHQDRVVHVPAVAVAVTPENGSAGEVIFADLNRDRMEFAELTSEMVPEDIGSLAR